MGLKWKLNIFFVFTNLVCMANQPSNELKLEFESKFETYSKLIKSIKCDFSQEKSMVMLENSVAMSGDFYYDSRGDICLDYMKPIGNKIIFTGEKFMMLNSGKKTVAKLSSNPMLRQLSQMLIACMTGDVSKFKSGWDIDYTLVSGEYILTLTPINSRVRRMVSNIVLHFVETDMSLSQMKMVEQNGNTSAYKFFNKVVNGEINASYFELN